MKNNLNILNLFQHNKLAIVLPSIDTENTNSSLKGITLTEGFRETLANIINILSTEKNFTYELTLSLFLHTNDNSKSLQQRILPDQDIYEDDENFESNLSNLMLAKIMFYSRYQNHGYSVLYQNTIDFRKIKINPYSYALAATRALGSKIIHTNEGLADEFIEFKKPVILNITRKPL